MATENAGIPRSLAVRLENGDGVAVDKLTVADLGAIVGYIRDAAPELKLSEFDDQTIAQAIMSLAVRLPGIVPQITACATKKTPEETGQWSPRDSLKILRAMLQVNDWSALVKDVKDFFPRR